MMGHRVVNRIQPALTAGMMQTYSISAPVATHTRPATCAEVECDAYLNGWKTVIDESTELGQAQAAYLRTECLTVLHPAQPGDGRRRYTESRDGALTVFDFGAGQHGFSPAHDHRVPLERPELYVVRGGDWRGNPLRTSRQHTRPDLWVEDFAEHQQAIADRIDKG